MRPLHILIPHALVDDAEAAPAARATLNAALNAQPGSLQLPRLRRLLRGTPHTRHVAENGVIAAHEQVQAAALGLDTQAPPWAALRAHELRLPGAATMVWAFLTPAHWVLPQGIGQTQVRLTDPNRLQLDEAEARAFFSAMRPYFAEDGLTLHLDTPSQWLVSGEPLRGLHSPAPERVLALGGDVAPWLSSASPSSSLLRRLQNEMQMLLYTQPANDAREERGRPSVNSFWLHGCGALAAVPEPTEDLTVFHALRSPALQAYSHGDWRAWAEAWQALDALLDAQLASAENAVLTLCGRNMIRTYSASAPAPGGFWQRLRLGLRPRHRLNHPLIELLIPA